MCAPFCWSVAAPMYPLARILHNGTICYIDTGPGPSGSRRTMFIGSTSRTSRSMGRGNRVSVCEFNDLSGKVLLRNARFGTLRHSTSLKCSLEHLRAIPRLTIIRFNGLLGDRRSLKSSCMVDFPARFVRRKGVLLNFPFSGSPGASATLPTRTSFSSLVSNRCSGKAARRMTIPEGGVEVRYSDRSMDQSSVSS